MLTKASSLFVQYNFSPFDEEDDLGPDMIPDLAERQEKADELEEQFMQTTVASEDEEYNREQDIYSQDEVWLNSSPKNSTAVLPLRLSQKNKSQLLLYKSSCYW